MNRTLNYLHIIHKWSVRCASLTCACAVCVCVWFFLCECLHETTQFMLNDSLTKINLAYCELYRMLFIILIDSVFRLKWCCYGNCYARPLNIFLILREMQITVYNHCHYIYLFMLSSWHVWYIVNLLWWCVDTMQRTSSISFTFDSHRYIRIHFCLLFAQKLSFTQAFKFLFYCFRRHKRAYNKQMTKRKHIDERWLH